MRHYIEIKGNKYYYTIIPNSNNETSKVDCLWANISQDFLNEDIPALLNDLKYLIIAEEKYKKSFTIRFRASQEEKTQIEKLAKENWYKNISSFIRDRVLH